MPFPWKKMRSTRISRLVNDHLQKSQRRRGDSSLVVETGFPTSLVDLFIKNREKLKKPSKKKRSPNTGTPPDDYCNDSVMSGSLSVSCSSSLCSSSLVHTPLSSPPQSRGVDGIAVLDTSNGHSSDIGNERGSGVNGGVDVIRVLVAVVKIFLALILAMGTEKLTMGMAISAFFLFFLEYVGKHASGLLEPCSKANEGLRLMVQSLLRSFRSEDVKSDEYSAGVLGYEVLQNESFRPCCSGLKKEYKFTTPIQEIQAVESKRFSIANALEIQCDKEMRNHSSHAAKSEHEKADSKEVIMERAVTMREILGSKGRKSHRVKMKSTMKKFFAKKLQWRKEHNSESCEVNPVTEDSIAICEEQNAQEIKDEIEPTNDSKSSALSTGREDEKDFVEEATLIAENGRPETVHNLRYLVLCVIVLVGLIGGRVFALVLSLLWCLMLKSS